MSPEGTGLWRRCSGSHAAARVARPAVFDPGRREGFVQVRTHMSGERRGESDEVVDASDTPGVRAAIARAKLEWEGTVDALPDLIALLGSAGQVVRINRVSERWNLGPVTEALGRDLHAVLHSDCKIEGC